MDDPYCNLVLTIKVNDAANAEAVQFSLPNADGTMTPVFVELASGLKACRCGGALKKARLRIVAPKSILVNRVPHGDIPLRGGTNA